MITITYRCGHSAEFKRSEMPATSQCEQCGERVVSRVSGDSKPKFKGACTGPLVVKA